jgi:hypothetical protein
MAYILKSTNLYNQRKVGNKKKIAGKVKKRYKWQNCGTEYYTVVGLP